MIGSASTCRLRSLEHVVDGTPETTGDLKPVDSAAIADGSDCCKACSPAKVVRGRGGLQKQFFPACVTVNKGAKVGWKHVLSLPQAVTCSNDG